MDIPRPSQWLESARADLKKARKLLAEDPDLAAFLAWQAARKALKILEKRSGKYVKSSSLEAILMALPEGQLAARPVREACKQLDLFKVLVQHDDLFEEGIRLGPLLKEDASRLLEAAKIVLTFLETFK